jgi:hypothetical protein
MALRKQITNFTKIGIIGNLRDSLLRAGPPKRRRTGKAAQAKDNGVSACLGKAYNDYITLGVPISPLLSPQIEYIVQIYVGELASKGLTLPPPCACSHADRRWHRRERFHKKKDPATILQCCKNVAVHCP